MKQTHEESSFYCVNLVKIESVVYVGKLIDQKQQFMRIVPFTVSTSLKNESVHHEDGSFPVSTSLKNETNPLLVKSSLSSDLVNAPSFHPAISNQQFSQLNAMKLGGHVLQQVTLGGALKLISSMIFPLFQACVKMKQTYLKHDFSFVSSLCKNETNHFQAQFSYVSSLYKNETYLESISVIIFKTR